MAYICCPREEEIPSPEHAANREIDDTCGVAAYCAFVNRIADGLRVDLEARFIPA